MCNYIIGKWKSVQIQKGESDALQRKKENNKMTKRKRTSNDL